jgi:hypothetical protein
MKFSRILSALICVALAMSMMSRTLNAAVMPYSMKSSSASTTVEKPAPMPCHGVDDAAPTEATGASSSCVFCGECCISSPPSPDFDASKWLERTPEHFARVLNAQRVEFLTPGIDRPPSL